MKLPHRRLLVYLLLPLGLLVLAACGSGGVRAPGQAATATAVATLPPPVRTDVAQNAPVPSTGPAGLPTDTPVPPPPTRDPARPITFAELRGAGPAPGGSPAELARLRAWAVDRPVQGWQGWVVDVDRQVGTTVIAALIVMDDPYTPRPPSPAGAPGTNGAESALPYVLVASLAANQTTRLQVGQQVRFGGIIARAPQNDFRVWLRDAQVVSVADPPQTGPVPPDLQGLRIMLERGGCYGPCPIYRVTVFGSGLLVWEGDSYVQTGGVRITTVDSATVRRLVAAFESTDYFAWNARYLDQRVTDNPSEFTAFERPGKRHSIDHYYGDPSAPRALGTLEAEIDAILHTAQWVGTR